jgi:hypothetical protein
MCPCVCVCVRVCVCGERFDQSNVVSLPSECNSVLVSMSTTGPVLFHTNVKRRSKQDWGGSILGCAVTADMTTYESQTHRSAKARDMVPTGSTVMGFLARETGAGSGDTWLGCANSVPEVREIVKPRTAVRFLQEGGSEYAQACTCLFWILDFGSWLGHGKNSLMTSVP